MLFSGGLDSTLLLKAATMYSGNVVALTFQGSHCPAQDLATAREMATILGVRHLLETFDPFVLADFRRNTPNRCYACKQAMYRRSLEIAAGLDAEVVLDGAHAEDAVTDRPGLIAAAELGIRSPLREAGFTKDQIRELSRIWSVPGWDRQAQSCLATRLPVNTPLDADIFQKIDRMEIWLRQRGFGPVRMRVHGELLRLELPPEQWAHVLVPEIQEALLSMAAASGWRYLTLDLRGYQSGSMNLRQEKKEEKRPQKTI